MTRIAILADIHGNLPAFEAALAHVAQHAVDQLILAGDIITGAPDALDCWRLAQSLGCPILRGNHERYAAHFGSDQAPPQWTSQQFAPLHWTVDQLSAADRQAMGQLPLSWSTPGAPDLLVVHASQRDDHASLASHTPEAALQAMFPSADQRCVVRAHNHIGAVRVWDGRFIITSGSVGLALDGHPTAQYLLLDRHKDGWHIQHQSVPYPVEAVLERFHTSGCLAATGPMGRLFYREIATASQQIVPFLRLYAGWSKQGEITLSQAVERFLSL